MCHRAVGLGVRRQWWRPLRALLWLAAGPLAAQITFPPDLSISRIEAVQTVQDEAQSVPLIAGKATAVRVFIRQQGRPEALLSGVSVFLRGYRDGAELAGSPLRAVNGTITAQPAPERSNPQHAQHFILPMEWTQAGALELRAELRLPPGAVETPADNNTLAQEVRFEEPAARQLRVAWLPVCIADSCATGPADAVQLAERLFPLAEGALHYEDVPAPPLRWKSAPGGAAASAALLRHLRKWFYFFEASPVAAHALVAWLPPGAQAFLPAAAAEGVAWMVEQAASRPNQAQLARSVAVAVGAGAASDCAALTVEPGFDPVTARVVAPGQAELLAHCPPDPSPWLSPLSARALVDAFGALKQEKAGVLIVSGTAAINSTSLDAAYPVASGVLPSSANEGTHCLRLTTSRSETERCFTPDAGGGFVLKLPLEGEPLRLRLLAQGAEIAALSASAQPTVEFLSPPWVEAAGRRQIRWRASDPLGRPLRYALFYSDAASEAWIPLAIDLTEPEWAVDTRYLAGAAIRFRVLASAGIDAVSAVSETVTLDNRPAIEVLPAALSFGNATTGQIVERAVTIRNTGSGVLEIHTLSGGGDAFRALAIEPFRVRAGARRALAIRYHPTLPGQETAVLTFETNASETPSLTVPLWAAAFERPVPSILAAPAALDFGEVAVGRTAQSAVLVRNEGTAALEITSLSTRNARFSVVAAAAPIRLAPGEERSFVIQFTPSGGTVETGEFNIASNDPTAPALRVALRGTGVQLVAPLVEVEPSALNFGEVNAGLTRFLSVTVRNKGNAALQLNRLTIDDPAFALAVAGLPITIAPGGQQVLSLRFAPVRTGPHTASLAIETNDPARPRVIIELRGTGLPAAAAPTPRIVALFPASLAAGGPRFNLTVRGSNFNTASVVHWNGSPRPTSFVSGTTLTASIAPEDVAAAGRNAVTVVNAGPGAGASNAFFVVVNPPGNAAQIHEVDYTACPSLVASMTVTDRIGGPITALNASNLACFEDGAPVSCNIRLAEPAGAGLSVVLVLHASIAANDPATRQRELQNMQHAALGFINAAGETDRIAITQMDNGVRLLRDFTEAINRSTLQDAVRNILPPFGIGTALYDAIEDGLKRLATQTGRRKAIVVLTGSENTYDTAGARDVPAFFQQLQATGVPVYLAAVGEAARRLSLISVMNQMALDSQGGWFADANLLLAEVMARLASALSAQHLVNYTTLKPDGQPHLFEVRISIPGATFTAARSIAGCPAR